MLRGGRRLADGVPYSMGGDDVHVRGAALRSRAEIRSLAWKVSRARGACVGASVWRVVKMKRCAAIGVRDIWSLVSRCAWSASGRTLEGHGTRWYVSYYRANRARFLRSGAASRGPLP